MKRFRSSPMNAVDKLDPEKVKETRAYQRFLHLVGEIEIEYKDALCNTSSAVDVIIGYEKLLELNTCIAELKERAYIQTVPSQTLTSLLNVLKININVAVHVSMATDSDDDPYERKLLHEASYETVMRAMTACTAALNILTSSNIPKTVCMEEVIDEIITFIEKQMQHTIYPLYDFLFITSSKAGSVENHKEQKKGQLSSGSKRVCRKSSAGRITSEEMEEQERKSIRTLYYQIVSGLILLRELVSLHRVASQHISAMCSLAVSPFFVSNIGEIHLAALRLLTIIFTTYGKSQDMVLSGLLTSTMTPSLSNQFLRTYKISSKESIQMLSAVVLQLIQCSADLSGTHITETSIDCIITKKQKAVMRAAGVFLLGFLKNCTLNKREDNYYRKGFEAFVQDLLVAGDKPEWPAVRAFFCILCNLCAKGLERKDTSVQFHVLCLRCLGLITAKVRSDAVLAQKNIEEILNIVKSLKHNEEESCVESNETTPKDHFKKTQILETLQCGLIDYLAVTISQSQDVSDPRHYYLIKWYLDYNALQKCDNKARKLDTSDEKNTPKISNNKKKRNIVHERSKGKEHHKENLNKQGTEENYKKFICKKLNSLNEASLPYVTEKHSVIKADQANLICKYLDACDSFSKSFSIYLQYVVCALSDSCTTICAEAVKCLTMIVDVDPSVLGREDIQQSISLSIEHSSITVREKTVDLIGRFILSQPEMFEKYCNCIFNFIQDSGVSVRKRVIKIMEEMYQKTLDHPKFPVICAKVLQRIYDEEDSVRKLVISMFYSVWFRPETEIEVQRKLHNIINVVSCAGDMGIKYFKELLSNIKLQFPNCNSRENSKGYIPCEQIVSLIVKDTLKSEKTATESLVWNFRILSAIAVVWPELLVPHAIVIHTYLDYHCEAIESYDIVQSAAEIIESVLPLIDYPSETFLSSIEESCIRNILRKHPLLIKPCMSCLATVVSSFTKNYTLISDCFKKYFIHLQNMQKLHEKNPESPILMNFKNFLKKALYVTGCFLRYFNFTTPELLKNLPKGIVDQVAEILFFFLDKECHDEFSPTLCALGALCVRHSEVMLLSNVKNVYTNILTSSTVSDSVKTHVLENIEVFLEDVEDRLIKENKQWVNVSQNHSLKEISETSSSIASAVIQTYLQPMLGANFDSKQQIRYTLFEVVRRSMSQGLIDPSQVMPYLIAASTDCDSNISYCAEVQLRTVHISHPRAISSKFLKGIEDSQRLQIVLQNTTVPRGTRNCVALHDNLYSLVHKTRQSRHAFLKRMLQEFDTKKTNLAWLVYLSDNLASFSYGTPDEPLFVIYHINLIFSVSSANLLQIFEEGLLENGKNEEESVESLLARLPKNIKSLQACITAFKSLELLLSVREHLQKLYSLSNIKISQYSPAENLKICEKPFSQQSNIPFEPKKILDVLNKPKQNVAASAERKQIILKYLEFKKLIEIDLEDPDISIDREQRAAELTNLEKNQLCLKKNKISKNAPHHKCATKRSKPKNKKIRKKRRKRSSSDEDELDCPSSSSNFSDPENYV